MSKKPRNRKAKRRSAQHNPSTARQRNLVLLNSTVSRQRKAVDQSYQMLANLASLLDHYSKDLSEEHQDKVIVAKNMIGTLHQDIGDQSDRMERNYRNTLSVYYGNVSEDLSLEIANTVTQMDRWADDFLNGIMNNLAETAGYINSLQDLTQGDTNDAT